MNFLTLFILIFRVFSAVDKSWGTISENSDTQMAHQQTISTQQESTEPPLSEILDQIGHEALAVWMKKSRAIPFQVRLPYNAIESNSKFGEIEYPNKKIQYLCPRGNPEDIDIFRETEMRSPDAEYCLLDNSWSPNTSKCRYEIRPYFNKVSRPTELEKSCGKLYENRLLYGFGFMDADGTPILKSAILGIYEICFDTYYSKTTWTRHTVRTGLMLKRPGLPSQRTEYPSKFATHSFDLPANIFTDIEAEYEKQKETNPFYIMKPQMLVPQDDIALILWKKTAQHHANTAPLWEKLVPLMNAINDGIRKVGVTIDLKNYENTEEIKEETERKKVKEQSEGKNENVISEKEEKYDEDERDTHTLYIYTSITTPYLPQLQRIFNTVVLFIFNQKNEPFGWNIWCKFIYYSHTNEGVMIYLHNLPDNPPEVSPPTQDNPKPKLLKGKECPNPVPCDFKSWSDDPNSISDEFLKYAYCCPVDKKKIDDLFNIEVDKVNLLNIDDIVKQNRY